MYRSIISDVTRSPVARTKYPLLHSAPPHNSSFISGISTINRFHDTLFNIFAKSAGLYRGGALTNRWMWSSNTSCSTIRNPYRSAIPSKIRFSVRATGSLNTNRRYFGTQTKWYFNSYTAWLVRSYSMLRNLPLFLRSSQNGVSSAPARGAVSDRGRKK